MMLPAIGEPPTVTKRRGWSRRWLRSISDVRGAVARSEERQRNRRRVLVNRPVWPGREDWQPPKPVPECPERFGDGFAFVVVSLPDAEAFRLRHGLTAWSGLVDGVVVDGG